MYQILARKYRPKTFNEVIGQDVIVKTLKNAVNSGRIAHAYIFSGTKGVGKTSLARILAKSINCKNGPTVDPCGTCSACAEIQNGSSVDVIEIDGASNTGVNDIRELKENILYSPQSLKYKIYIIDEVHMLSNSAFNALLKTLEEPPSHVKFIFATTEIHKVPETILSRCQRFTFKRIPPSTIYTKLKDVSKEENIIISEENLMTIANISDGSLRDALSTLDTVISYYGKEINDDVSSILGITPKEALKNAASAIFRKDYENSIAIVNDIYISGADIRQFIRQLAYFIRNILVIKLNYQSLITDMLEGEAGSLAPLAGQKSPEELLDMIDILMESEVRYQRISSPQLMIELVIFKLLNVPSRSDMKKLIEKIDKIEINKIDKLNSVSPVKTVMPPSSNTALSENNYNNYKVNQVNPDINAGLLPAELELETDRSGNSPAGIVDAGSIEHIEQDSMPSSETETALKSGESFLNFINSFSNLPEDKAGNDSPETGQSGNNPADITDAGFREMISNVKDVFNGYIESIRKIR